MASLAEIERALRAADAAGNVEDARALAKAYQDAKAASAAPVQQAAPSPVPQKRGFMTGVAQGLTDPLLALGQVGIGLREAVGIPSSISGDKAKEMLRQREADIAASRGPDAGFDWARTAGNVVAEAPLMALPGGPVAGGMLAGGVSGALQPATGTGGILEQKAAQVGLGAAAGGLGGAAVKGIGAILGGPQQALPAATRAVQAEGVRPTVGQAAGGVAKDIEERLATLPFAGRPIRNAQQRATETLNKAAYNRVLAPIGENVPADLKPGHEAVAMLGDKLSDAYEKVVPNLQFQQTPKFALGIANINVPGLGPDATATANRIVQETIGQKPQLSGEAVKSVESQLSGWARRYHSSPDPVNHGIAEHLDEALDVFRREIQNQNPDFAPKLRAIDEGWANLVRVEGAAAKSGAQEGTFTAAQLQQAVRDADRSTRKRGVARGEALMQDLSGPAKSVLGREIGSSGTAERMAMMEPFKLAGGLAALPGTALAYSDPGQRALINLLVNRPQIAQQARQALQQAGPAAGLLGGSAAGQLLP